MSLFDSASLVVTPNGYKEDKLYSIKPTDGSGDLVVTRATTATRVNSDGLIEQVPYNLVTYSEDFTNASWIKSNATITSNSTTAPNGTLTADTILANSAAVNAAYKVISTEGIMTLSVYAKANTSNFIYIEMFDITPPVDYVAIFDLSNGTYIGNGGFGSVDSYNIESVGNGWFKISITKNLGTGLQNHNYIIGVAKAGNSIIPVSNTSVYIWGAQLVSGTSAKEYFPTTDRLDVPRLDYTNSTCPSILVEPQRTNLALYSEQFDNAYWVKSESTTTANFATSPNGTMSADTIAVNSNNAVHRITNAIAVTNATTYTLSIYAKKNNFDFIFFRENIDGNFTNTFFNVSNGNLGSIGLGRTARIQNVGNGWYRCSITGTSALTSYSFGFGVSNTDGVISFLGNGTDYNLIWGAQLEAGSNDTSYVPTIASSVTRNADVISKTGISSLIGQTEGTMFAEFYHNGQDVLSTQQVLFVSSGNTNNFLAVGVYDGRMNPAVRASSTDVFDLLVGPNPLSQGRHKVALAYKSGDFAVYLDGVSIYTNTNSATFGTMSQLDLGTTLSFNTQLGDGIKSAALWKTRLSDTELASLTTI